MWVGVKAALWVPYSNIRNKLGKLHHLNYSPNKSTKKQKILKSRRVLVINIPNKIANSFLFSFETSKKAALASISAFCSKIVI